jgi:hypothetical protein
LILTHPKEVVLLRDLIHRTEAIRTLSLYQILFGPEAFTGDTVPTIIIVLIDLSTIVEILKDLLNHLLMTYFCCTDEIIVGDIQSLPEGLESNHHLVAVYFWIDPSLLSGFLYLLAMFICAGEEKSLITL